ncbi:MAG: hypothetical protein M3419_07160 [Actinomycetota bacterium]|nr:hypothetical protein [Actinomycetota bacterium]
MNGIDELRNTMHEQVHAQEQIPMAQRMASVRRRRTSRRRTRLVGSMVGAVAVVAATVVIAPAFVDSGDGEPPVVGEGGEGSDEGYSFPERLDGDTLITSTVGEVGESEISWSLTLEDLDVAVHRRCRVPGRFDPSLGYSQMMIASTLEVNGQPVGTRLCQPGREVLGFSTVDVDRESSQSWAAAGARAGEPFTLTLRLEDRGEPITIDRASLGLGIYEPTGERVGVAGIEMPQILNVEDQEFSLVDVASAPGQQGAAAALEAGGEDPYGLIVYGWVDGPGSARAILSNGRNQMEAWLSGDALQTYPLDGQPGRLRLTAEQGREQGTLVVAYYVYDDTLEDES